MSAVQPSSQPFEFAFALDVRGGWADSTALGVGLHFDVGRTFGAFLELSSSSERRAALGNGFVHWQQSGLSLGGRYRKDWGRWFFEPGVSAGAEILVMRGAGFNATHSVLGVDSSVCVRVHGGVRVLGPVGVLVGISGCAFPIDTRIGVLGVEDTFALPRGQVGILAGLFWTSAAVQGSSAPGP